MWWRVAFLRWHWLQEAKADDNRPLTSRTRQCRHLWLLASFACLCECLKGYCGFSGFPLKGFLMQLCGIYVKHLCRDWNANGRALVAFMDLLLSHNWDGSFACSKKWISSQTKIILQSHGFTEEYWYTAFITKEYCWLLVKSKHSNELKTSHILYLIDIWF